MLKPGERLWNGKIVTPQLADVYNRINSKIAAIEADGKMVPENLLNGRHNLIGH